MRFKLAAYAAPILAGLFSAPSLAFNEDAYTGLCGNPVAEKSTNRSVVCASMGKITAAHRKIDSIYATAEDDRKDKEEIIEAIEKFLDGKVKKKATPQG